ncbi:MAG: DUF1810 domain-containing protein [Segetibacter sp.]
MNSNNTLTRFLSAQQNIYSHVLKELQAGEKVSHWKWFIFPQIEGLGHSSTAKYYSIKSINEAKEYIDHPILGKRLLECSSIILQTEGKSVEDIFGYPDYLKLKSCMTLFNYAVHNNKVFAEVLNEYFAGEHDEQTISILQKMKN